MLSGNMKTKDDEVLYLIQEILTGDYKVAGYTSEWPKRGPANRRKMTIIIEDTHFDRWGHRVKPEHKVTELYDEYEVQKAARNLLQDGFYRLLDKMIEAGEAKQIDGPDETGFRGIIVTRDKELMANIAEWDIDEDGDIVFYSSEDVFTPIRCDNVELW